MHLQTGFAWRIFFFAVFLLLLFQINKTFIQFKYNWVKGVLLNIMIFSIGLLLLSYNNYSNHKRSLTQIYKKGSVIIAKLEEPLTEKSKTFKAEASVQIVTGNGLITAKTHILVYMQKDSALYHLTYGAKIIFRKSLQPIRNSGNPDAFDYQRYCIFQHIDYQIYFQKNEFIILPATEENIFKTYLFLSRRKLLTILQTFLKPGKETGLAEALLIGYKDDLDKNLIQSYTQTGVVHIIAISGLHLALIYGIIEFCLNLIKDGKKFRRTKPLVLISSLWLFSFLSGASPSVLRSAVMFSFIVIGKQFSKSSSIYNSLAASAFVLLCYNPFWLWDVGFQLSYGAVLSIVIFMQPIYNWFFIQNKILDLIWKSTSVTIAAQILTFPVSIYYFHQFPNYFLITNLLAVPLSSLVLLGELLVCVLSFIPVIASITGAIVSWLIFILNSFIEHMQSLPFSIWDHLYVNLVQLISIYAIIIFINSWMIKKKKSFLFATLLILIFFVSIRTFHFIKAYKQKILLVYNVPQHQAIDLIEGRNYRFICDSSLFENNFLQNLYLQPVRISYRIFAERRSNYREESNVIFQLGSKKIIVMDQSVVFIPPASKVLADIIIISKNPSITIHNLQEVFNCRQWIFDSSNSSGKINKWKKECEQLGLPYHAVVDKGAFVMNMD